MMKSLKVEYRDTIFCACAAETSKHCLNIKTVFPGKQFPSEILVGRKTYFHIGILILGSFHFLWYNGG